MAEKITNYQCPKCGGPLHFDGGIGKLKCDYCDSEYEVAEIEALYETKNEQAEAADDKWELKEDEGWGGDEEKLCTYSCPSCGAELVTEETTGASECPYCGNPTIIPKTFSGMRKPDFVLPFEVTKDQAVAALRKHYLGKPLLPKLFKDRNHIEKVQGIYVPFWLFDGTADGSMTYHGERTHSHRDGNYDITEIDEYELYRAGHISFEKVPADASSKMENAMMDSIEPFDFSKLQPFNFSYLPGYLADCYDETAEQNAERVVTRMKNTALGMFRATTGAFSDVTTAHTGIRIEKGKIYGALIPVWMLTTRYEDKPYTFLMNGQTGKFIGDLPIDNKAVTKFRIIYTVAIGAVLFGIQFIAAHL